MGETMKKVFEEASIGSIKLNNRIIRSATHESMADENGRPTEKLIRKYEAMAKGEVGAIITGYAGIQQNGKAPLKNMLMIDRDELIESYKEMVNAVHKYNTPIILQIAHCGRQTSSKITGLPTVAPSPIRDKLYNEDLPHQLSETEINEVINNFVLSIERAKKAGFDGVQLHLAHGYLLSSFLSPHMNKRKDKWGGSTENRFRIVKEIMKLARERIGDYPILVKMNAYEKSKDGIKIEEAIKIAQFLEQSGCNAIEVSCGIAEEGFVVSRGGFPYDMIFKYNHRMSKLPKFIFPFIKRVLKRTMSSPEPYSLYNLSNAEEIKNHVKIPVIVVGGIREMNDIKVIIEQDKSDFVSMSRPFVIESDIVKKFREGRQTKSKCINCNYCMIGTEVESLKCYYGRI
jgi:2,4-dienoyl-CoA reductase-like NADH-dependent reductase (Old Yellow Enzyme family)